MKHNLIYFELINADRLPAGASVRWTVRNRGHDAWSKNDIGHFAGGSSRPTSTPPTTTTMLWMSPFYQWGRMIGRRRVEINVRGSAMPARNKPSKCGFRRR